MTDPPTAQLRAKNLTVDVVIGGHAAPIVNDVSFDVAAGGALGIVGESGCGKSTLALALMGLVGRGVRIRAEALELGDIDLTNRKHLRSHSVRGGKIGMVFQEPMTSLDPAFTVGSQLIEVLRRHHDLSKAQARERAAEILHDVELPDAEQRLNQFPHEMSGGMRQRVCIGLALCGDPSVLIADEPTTALDVSTQAQILELLKRLRRDRNMTVILISHDLGVIADFADHMMVMYAGQVVESGDVFEVFESPKHPYTAALVTSIPNASSGEERLGFIPGSPPPVGEGIQGCAFAPRCDYVDVPRCTSSPVELRRDGAGHAFRCLRSEEISLQGVS